MTATGSTFSTCMPRGRWTTRSSATSTPPRTCRVDRPARLACLPNALEPGPPGSWDDVATWTGSAVHHDGLWRMFYTGVSTAEDGPSSGSAWPPRPTLAAWTQASCQPTHRARRALVRTARPQPLADQAWRDPWACTTPMATVFMPSSLPCPRGRPTMRVASSATSWSSDSVAIGGAPPLTEPGEFGQPEVPQVADHRRSAGPALSPVRDQRCLRSSKSASSGRAERNVRRLGDLVAGPLGHRRVPTSSRFLICTPPALFSIGQGNGRSSGFIRRQRARRVRGRAERPHPVQGTGNALVIGKRPDRVASCPFPSVPASRDSIARLIRSRSGSAVPPVAPATPRATALGRPYLRGWGP